MYYIHILIILYIIQVGQALILLLLDLGGGEDGENRRSQMAAPVL